MYSADKESGLNSRARLGYGLKVENVPAQEPLISCLQYLPENTYTKICVFVFGDRVSLCNSSGSPGTHFVDQTGFKLTEVHLPLPLDAQKFLSKVDKGWERAASE